MTTNQETFDTVVTHLRAQGERAMGLDPATQVPACFYRAPDGKRCAAGWLIPDDRYDPAFEHTGLGGMDDSGRNSNGVTLLMEELGHDIELVAELQSIHDNAPLDTWEDRFRQLAEHWGLHYAPRVATAGT
jgi:hypothetical protein